MAKDRSKNKRSGKKATEFSLTCVCGAQSRVYAIGEKGYMAHCPAAELSPSFAMKIFLSG